MSATCVVAAVGLGLSGAARGDDKVGVFFFGEPPSISEIQTWAGGASVTSSRDGQFTRIQVRWPNNLTLMMSIDPAWARERQLAGIRGWLGGFPRQETSTPEVKAFLANLDKVTTCWGSVVSPSFDQDGQVARLLGALVRQAGGFLFSSGQAFYRADGARIIGLPGSPASLGARK